MAVDADFKPGIERDQWMAKEFIRLSGEAPVLALLGSLHTLKEVDWRYKEFGNKLYVAGILKTKELEIKSYPQAWTDRHCNSRARFISADTSEATEILNNNVMSSLNAFKRETAVDVVDGIILWEC